MYSVRIQPPYIVEGKSFHSSIEKPYLHGKTRVFISFYNIFFNKVHQKEKKTQFVAVNANQSKYCVGTR